MFMSVIRSIIVQSPLLLAYIIALIIVLTRWGQYPKVCLQAFLGVFVLGLLVFFRASEGLILDLLRVEHSVANWRIIGVVANLAEMTAFLLLLGAIFIGRSERAMSARRRPERSIQDMEPA